MERHQVRGKRQRVRPTSRVHKADRLVAVLRRQCVGVPELERRDVAAAKTIYKSDRVAGPAPGDGDVVVAAVLADTGQRNERGFYRGRVVAACGLDAWVGHRTRTHGRPLVGGYRAVRLAVGVDVVGEAEAAADGAIDGQDLDLIARDQGRGLEQGHLLVAERRSLEGDVESAGGRPGIDVDVADTDVREALQEALDAARAIGRRVEGDRV